HRGNLYPRGTPRHRLARHRAPLREVCTPTGNSEPRSTLLFFPDCFSRVAAQTAEESVSLTAGYARSGTPISLFHCSFRPPRSRIVRVRRFHIHRASGNGTSWFAQFPKSAPHAPGCHGKSPGLSEYAPCAPHPATTAATPRPGSLVSRDAAT